MQSDHPESEPARQEAKAEYVEVKAIEIESVTYTTSSAEFELWFEQFQLDAKPRLESVRDHFALSQLEDAMMVSVNLAAFVVAELKRGSRVLIEHKNKTCSELVISNRVRE